MAARGAGVLAGLALAACGAGGGATDAGRPLSGADRVQLEDVATVAPPATDWALVAAALAQGRGVFALADDPSWIVGGGPVLAAVLGDHNDLCERLAARPLADGVQLGLWARQVAASGSASSPDAGVYAVDANQDPFVRFAVGGGLEAAAPAQAPEIWWPRRPAGTPFWWPREPAAGLPPQLALVPGRHGGVVLLARGAVPTRACRPCEAKAQAARARPAMPHGEVVLDGSPAVSAARGVPLVGRIRVRLAGEPSAFVATDIALSHCPRLAREPWTATW